MGILYLKTPIPDKVILKPGPWSNIKMSSYQYRESHCGDKTVVRWSYFHNGISYTGKTVSLYWIRALAHRTTGSHSPGANWYPCGSPVWSNKEGSLYKSSSSPTSPPHINNTANTGHSLQHNNQASALIELKDCLYMYKDSRYKDEMAETTKPFIFLCRPQMGPMLAPWTLSGWG